MKCEAVSQPVEFKLSHRCGSPSPGTLARQQCAAAVLTFLCRGLRFFHDGQFQGRKKKAVVHLNRRPEEMVDTALLEFYKRLLACVNLSATRNGEWSLLESAGAWEGNWTAGCFVCFAWADLPQDRLVVVVNFAPNQSQCYLRLPFKDLAGRSVLLEDLMGHETYKRDGTELSERGLYVGHSCLGLSRLPPKNVMATPEWPYPHRFERRSPLPSPRIVHTHVLCCPYPTRASQAI